MKGPTFKWPSTGRLRRTVLMLGVVGATTGGLLFTAAAAQAVTGSGPGQLTFSPASGASTVSPTWSTSTACPANFNTSAVLFVLNTDGTIGSSASPTVASVTAPFSGTLLNNASIASIVSLGSNVSTSGGTATFVVGCFSAAGGLGNVTYVQTTQVQFSANGSTYGPVVAATATTTALGLSTTTPAPGATVTLTATVTPASGTAVPTGSVQFTAGGTNIGTPVTLSATGVATTTTVAPATAGTVVPVSAVFTPTGTFSGSTGTNSFTVVGSNGPFPIPVTFTVGATGAFTFTANTNAVTLTVDAANTTGTGNLNGNAITVTDTRNTFPGWSVTGQESNFTVPAPGTASISGNQLGWTPTSTGTLPAGVILGGTVAPASPGLGTTAAVLAQEHSGANTGTSSANLSANLLLAIPAAQPAGTYSGTLTLTAVQSLP